MNKKKQIIMDGIRAKRKGCNTIINVLAVAILIFGSLINIVGYQSAKSGSTTDSPLFGIRTQNANRLQQNIFTSDYLGKGTNTLLFPQRDNRTAMIQKIIGIIQKMDDKEFDKFLLKLRINPKRLVINQFDKIDDHPPLLIHVGFFNALLLAIGSLDVFFMGFTCYMGDCLLDRKHC